MSSSSLSPIASLLVEAQQWTQKHQAALSLSPAVWRSAFTESDPDWAELAQWVMDLSTQVSVDFMSLKNASPASAPLKQALDKALKELAQPSSWSSKVMGRSVDRKIQAQQCQTLLASWSAARQEEVAQITATLELAGLMEDAGQLLLEYPPQLEDVSAVSEGDVLSQRVARRREEARTLAQTTINQVIPLLRTRAPQWEQMAQSLRRDQAQALQEMTTTLTQVQQTIEAAQTPTLALPTKTATSKDQGGVSGIEGLLNKTTPAPLAREMVMAQKKPKTALGLPFLADKRIPQVSRKTADALIRIRTLQIPSVLRLHGEAIREDTGVLDSYRLPGSTYWEDPSFDNVFDEHAYQSDIERIAGADFLDAKIPLERDGGALPAPHVLLRHIAGGYMKFWPAPAREKIVRKLDHWVASSQAPAGELNCTGVNEAVWYAACLKLLRSGQTTLGCRMIVRSPFRIGALRISGDEQAYAEAHMINELAHQLSQLPSLIDPTLGGMAQALPLAAADGLIKEHLQFKHATPPLPPLFWTQYAAPPEPMHPERYADLLLGVVQDQGLDGLINFLNAKKDIALDVHLLKQDDPAIHKAQEKVCAVLINVLREQPKRGVLLFNCTHDNPFFNPPAPHLLKAGAMVQAWKMLDHLNTSSSTLSLKGLRHLAEHAPHLLLETPGTSVSFSHVKGKSALEAWQEESKVFASFEQARAWVHFQRPLHLLDAAGNANPFLQHALAAKDFHLITALVESAPDPAPAFLQGAMRSLYENEAVRPKTSPIRSRDWLRWLLVSGQGDLAPAQIMLPPGTPQDYLHAYGKFLLNQPLENLAKPPFVQEHVARLSRWIDYAAQDLKHSSVLNTLEVATNAWSEMLQGLNPIQSRGHELGKILQGAVAQSLRGKETGKWSLNGEALSTAWHRAIVSRRPSIRPTSMEGYVVLGLSKNAPKQAPLECKLYPYRAVAEHELRRTIDLCRVDRWVYDHLKDTAGFPRPGMEFRAGISPATHSDNGETSEAPLEQINYCAQVEVSPHVSAEAVMDQVRRNFIEHLPEPPYGKVVVEGLPYMQAFARVDAAEGLLRRDENGGDFILKYQPGKDLQLKISALSDRMPPLRKFIAQNTQHSVAPQAMQGKFRLTGGTASTGHCIVHQIHTQERTLAPLHLAASSLSSTIALLTPKQRRTSFI